MLRLGCRLPPFGLTHSNVVGRGELKDLPNGEVFIGQKLRGSDEQRARIVMNVLDVRNEEIILEKRVLEVSWNRFDNVRRIFGCEERRTAEPHVLYSSQDAMHLIISGGVRTHCLQLRVAIFPLLAKARSIVLLFELPHVVPQLLEKIGSNALKVHLVQLEERRESVGRRRGARAIIVNYRAGH